MNTEQVLKKHADFVKANGIAPLAEEIVAKGSTPLSEHEFSDLVMTAARLEKKAGQTDAQAFAKLFERDETIRKAHAICKSAAYSTTVASDTMSAYRQLQAKAEELRRSQPYLSAGKAFEVVFADPANGELAAATYQPRA